MSEVEFVFLASGKGVAIVDPEDFPLVQRYRWRLSKGHAITEVRRNGKRTSLSMHRLLAGAADGEIVDHRNGNRLDNRRANLRKCDAGENARNAAPHRKAFSEFRGVWLSRGLWRAAISVDRQRRYLGYFKSEAVAALAYDVAAIRLHRKFARTNILHP